MRNKVLFAIIPICIILGIGWYAKDRFYPQKQIVGEKTLCDGDIIFQESTSSQCIAVQRATRSKYSHCGIIYIKGNKTYVYEAIQPVKVTPFDEWIQRGKRNHYVVKRLKKAEQFLTKEALTKMKEESEKFMGKNYDLTFEWSDDKIYCSELIWKIYKRALNIEVGKLQKLKDMDLTSTLVKEKLEERYGDNIPLDETVISPAAIFDSKLLEEIFSN